MLKFRYFPFPVMCLVAVSVIGGVPDWTGANNYPAMMALATLKNRSITGPDKVDSKRTQAIRLASEKIGQDLYRQIHLVTFTEKSGKKIQAVVINNVSSKEGAMSSPDIYVVNDILSDYPWLPKSGAR